MQDRIWTLLSDTDFGTTLKQRSLSQQNSALQTLGYAEKLSGAEGNILFKVPLLERAWLYLTQRFGYVNNISQGIYCYLHERENYMILLLK